MMVKEGRNICFEKGKRLFATGIFSPPPVLQEPDGEPPRQECVAALEARAIAQAVLRELVHHDLSQKDFARHILNAPSAVLCMMLRKASEDLTDVTAPKAVKALLRMKDWMELGDSERALAYQSWQRVSGSRPLPLRRYGPRRRREKTGNRGSGAHDLPGAEEASVHCGLEQTRIET